MMAITRHDLMVLAALHPAETVYQHLRNFYQKENPMGIIVGAFEPYLVAVPFKTENDDHWSVIELGVLAWEIDTTGPLTPYTVEGKVQGHYATVPNVENGAYISVATGRLYRDTDQWVKDEGEMFDSPLPGRSPLTIPTFLDRRNTNQHLDTGAAGAPTAPESPEKDETEAPAKFPTLRELTSPPRACTALEKAGIVTVDDLRKSVREGVAAIKGVSDKSMEFFDELLAGMNWTWKGMEAPEEPGDPESDEGDEDDMF